MIPQIINDVFSNDRFERLKNTLTSGVENYKWDAGFGRRTVMHWDEPLLQIYNNFLITTAREVFNNQTMIPTYSQYIEYSGKGANLFHHVDNNACTYTIDVLIHNKTPWTLWVEGKEFDLKENQGVAYMGNDHEHWREEFTDPDNNIVGMALFHFAEPDHWYFREGPEYIFEVMKKQNGIM